MNERRMLRVATGMLIMASPAGCSRGSEKAESQTVGTHVAPATDKMSAKEARLPGAEISLAQALKTADLIVMARISRVPPAGEDAPGESSYSPVEIHIQKVLRGISSGKMLININVRGFPPDKAEATPRVGDQYLFLFSSKILIKMLYPTEENIKACLQ